MTDDSTPTVSAGWNGLSDFHIVQIIPATGWVLVNMSTDGSSTIFNPVAFFGLTLGGTVVPFTGGRPALEMGEFFIAPVTTHAVDNKLGLGEMLLYLPSVAASTVEVEETRLSLLYAAAAEASQPC